jgi:hypothetical protein
MTAGPATGHVRRRDRQPAAAAPEASARAFAARLRAPWRKAFAAQWIAYRWRGAIEPCVPEGMRPRDFVRFIGRLGGWPPGHFSNLCDRPLDLARPSDEFDAFVERVSAATRLVRDFPRGSRVRAALDIYYAVGDVTIAAGHQGTVLAQPHIGLLFVAWDAYPGDWSTAGDCVDPCTENTP